MHDKTYLCIDLKSFYASVECVERKLDPMITHLVVADSSRTKKTICLAVSPSLKAYGIPGRARLFEVIQKVKEVNHVRQQNAPGHHFTGESYNAVDLQKDSSLALSYVIAPPRMAHYMEYSTRIYQTYLKYIAPEDIHVYSIDEVFMDLTHYLGTYHMTAYNLAKAIIRDVLKSTGITATAGIGTNLYLAKVAMDIMAKKMPPDEDGVRIATLDEMTYRKELWTHRPLTDFWRVGRGYSTKLEQHRLYTMGDIARCSLSQYGEDKLYQLFGVNAELLIDHAWGWEPCTMEHIHSYRPENKSLGTGQVLHCPYDVTKARLIVREMLELLMLDLVEKHLVTDQLVLTVGYDVESLNNPTYQGEIITDHYGRKMPKHAHGTANLGTFTSSTILASEKVLALYDEIVNPALLVRKVNLSANHVCTETEAQTFPQFEQLTLLENYDEAERQHQQQQTGLKKERAIQETTIALRNQFGKNAILKGMNLQEGATTRDRNKQIGGHKA